jgi:hypothetical protein
LDKIDKINVIEKGLNLNSDMIILGYQTKVE